MSVRTLAAALYRLASGVFLSSRRPCNIAMFHTGRCGSRVLGDSLKQHPKIVWEGELLSPGRLEGIASRWPLLTRDRMNILRLRMLMAGQRCFGFETQPTQVELLGKTLEQYVSRLDELGFSRFVLLERKNHLRRIVSIMLGHHTAKWHLSSSDSASLQPFALDVERLCLNWGPDTKPSSLSSHLHRAEESVRELKATLSGHQLLCLTYKDDIAASPEVGYRRVCEFVGVAEHPVSVRFRKTNPFDLSDVLTNFAQVERVLAGTEFEWMLYS